MTINAPRTSADCLSELRLDRLLAGELSGEETAVADGHVASCAACMQRREQRHRDRSTFERALGVGTLPPRPRADAPTLGELRRRRRLIRDLAFAGAAAVAAAIVVLVVLPRREPDEVATTRAKGSDPELHYWVLRDGRSVPDTEAGAVRAGDQIRFGYDWSAGGWLALISLDGRGATSVYTPDPAATWRAPAGRDVLLPDAIRLDDAPGPEVVHAWFCERAHPLVELRPTAGGAPDDCIHVALPLPRPGSAP